MVDRRRDRCGTVDVVARVVREGIVRDSPDGGKPKSVDVEAEQLSTGDRVLSAPVGTGGRFSASARKRRKHVMRAPSRRSRSTPTANGCTSRRSRGRPAVTAILERSISQVSGVARREADKVGSPQGTSLRIAPIWQGPGRSISIGTTISARRVSRRPLRLRRSRDGCGTPR